MGKGSCEFARDFGRDVREALFDSFYGYQSGQMLVDDRFTFFNVKQTGFHSFTFEAVFEDDNGETVEIVAHHGDEIGSFVDSWTKTARATGKGGLTHG